MPRLSTRVARMVPPIRRRQDRIESLEQRLTAAQQEISELEASYTQRLQRSRKEAAKWRKLTRSKVDQLEDERGRVGQTSFRAQLVNYRATYQAMSRLGDRSSLVMRQIPYKLRNYSFAQSHGVSVPEVFGVWSSPSDIDLSTLGVDKFVLKADGGFGGQAVWPLVRDDNSWVAVGGSTRLPDGPLPVEMVEKMGAFRGPFFAEEMLEGLGSSTLPEDIKIYVSYGEVLQVLVMRQDRRGSLHRELFTRGYFDKAGQELGPVLRGARYGDVDPPASLPRLVKIAKRLSTASGLPFIRVDLYETDQGPVLGELTLLPGGKHDYLPKHDRRMGRQWAAGRARLERDISAGRPPGLLFGPNDYDWHYPEDGEADGPNSWPRRSS